MSLWLISLGHKEAKELHDLPNRYRLWLIGWRIIYRVDDDTESVLILAVRRKTEPETYEDLA